MIKSLNEIINELNASNDEKTTYKEMLESNESDINNFGRVLVSLSASESLKEGLNPDQIKAYNEIIEYLIGDNEYQGVVLSGYAGTGKTFLIKRIVEFMSIYSKLNIAITAPTNKAVHILEKNNPYVKGINLFKTQNKGIEYSTIHKLFGLSEIVDDEGHITYKKVARDNSKRYGLIIVDEISMLDDELLELVIDTGSKLVLMGDPCQIPPVNKSDCEVFRKDCRFNFLRCHLNIIMRQAEGNPIIETSVKIRENLNKEQPVDKVTRIINGTGVEYITENKSARVRELCEMFNSIEYRENRNYIKIICWRNATIKYYNDNIRKIMFGNIDKRFVPGESVIANSTLFNVSFYDDNPWVKCGNNSDEFIIRNVSENNMSFNIGGNEFEGKFYILDVVDYDGHRNTLRCVHEDSMKDYVAFYRNLKVTAIKEKNSGAWMDYYDALKINHDITYNYAISSHKAQGSTYENVILTESDLDMNKKVVERNRIKYTAYTRASKMLYVI